ncbi:MAG: helix-hairpin-helix domain-containing protein, partial [Planctomycetota bacterium]
MAEPAQSTSLVEGVLERIAFRNDDTHFTVAKVQPDAGGPLVTCVGPLFGVDEGSWVRIEGTFQESRFGRQLRVKSFEAGTPNTAIGIQKYLSAGLVKGIGEELAKRIVKHFGAETLEVLEKQPKRLLEVEGIGRKRLERLKEAWGEHCAARRVLIFLRGHGVGAAHAARILKAYGDHADEVVRKNPYRLAEDIHGIGFLTADRLGRELGIQHDAPERVEAGLVHV